jgi:Trypsin
MDCGRGRAGVMQHDLAVVVLDEPQPGPYASLPKLNLTERLQKKMPLTLVGYGAIAGDRKRQPLQVFQRFVGEGELKNLGGRIDDFFIGLSGKKDVATPCFGDSGGPDLLPGTTTVVGLTSWANNVKTCLGKSFSYRLDTAESLAFIGQYLNP